jgi:hypothetical protein
MSGWTVGLQRWPDSIVQKNTDWTVPLRDVPAFAVVYVSDCAGGSKHSLQRRSPIVSCLMSESGHYHNPVLFAKTRHCCGNRDLKLYWIYFLSCSSCCNDLNWLAWGPSRSDSRNTIITLIYQFGWQYNTMQVSTHCCSTELHTTTVTEQHYNTLQYSAAHFKTDRATLQHWNTNTQHYNTELPTTTHWNTLLQRRHTTRHYKTESDKAARYSTLQHRHRKHYNTQHTTTQTHRQHYHTDNWCNSTTQKTATIQHNTRQTQQHYNT